MTFNDLYVYTLAHLAEHYLSAGSCFRPIMDLFLIERKHAEELDFVYINKQFEILGIKKFAENIRKLYGCMFSEGNYTEELSIMENYIVLGPPIKNAATVSNAMTTQKSKPRMIFETIFPSLSHMKLKYPILEKHPVLLPVFWVIRLFQYLFTKDTRITKKRKELITYDEENISVIEEILKKSGF